VFELALALGQPEPSAMLAAMRPSTFGLWCAKFRLDPWGEQRADLRLALLTSTLAEIHRNSERRSAPFRAIDFMPYAERPPETGPDPAAEAERLAAAFGLSLKTQQANQS